MNCTHVKKRLTRYLERMCGNEEVAEIARHIESCPYCARELRGLQSVRGMLRCCRSGKPAAVAVAEVQTAILEGTTHAHMVPGLKRRDSAHRRQPRQYIAVAATLLLAAGGLIWESIRPAEAPVVQQTLSNDDMFFILQEHALMEDQSVFTSGTLGSVMVNYKE
jgi:anti-sigma factor RsiW